MSKNHTWLTCLAAAIALAACNSDTSNDTQQPSTTSSQPTSSGTQAGETSVNGLTPSTSAAQFSDLQGNASNVTTTFLITEAGGLPVQRAAPPDFGVRLYGTLQSPAAFDAIRAFVRADLNTAMIQPSTSSSAPILPLLQSDYFEKNTIVIVDAWSARMHILKLINISEQADKIQIAFELCSNDEMFQGSHFAADIWFSIPKTTKPVEILPLRYPPNPGWHPFNPEMGVPRCSA